MQMFAVAFSRRMCCSRVCRASRSAGLPSASRDMPDQPAGQLAGQLLPHRQVAGVRAAEAQRHPEALRGADRGVRAELAGRGEQGQREQVRGHRDQRAALVRGVDQRRGSRTAPDAPG